MASTARIDELKKKFDENPRRYFAPLANEFRKSGEIEQAIMICEEFLPQQPGHMSGHIVYGQALYESGRLPESRGVFETALGLDPENLIALRHLGDIARAQHDPASARSWYDRVLDADPRNEEIQSLIAGLDADDASELSLIDVPSAAEGTATGLGMEVEKEQPPFDKMPTREVAATPFDQLPTREIAAQPLADLSFADTAPAGVPVIPSAPVSHTPLAPALVDGFSLSGFGTHEENDGATRDTAAAEGFESTEFAPPTELIPSEKLDASLDSGVPSFSAPAHHIEALDGLEGSGGHAHPGEGTDRTAISRVEPLDLEGGLIVPSAAAALPPSPPDPSQADRPAAADLLDFDLATPLDTIPAELPPAVIAAEAELIAAGETPQQGSWEESATPAASRPPFVTETMAELYLAQGFHEQALSVYSDLLAASPADERLAAIVASLTAAPAVADAGPNVRDFFARLAGRRPGTVGAAYEPPADDDFAREAGPNGPADDAPVVEEEVPREIPAGVGAAGSVPPALERAAATQHAGGSIDALFGSRVAGTSEDSAAAALAQAFGGGSEVPVPQAIPGKAAHAAKGELSLDSVFRDGPARPARTSQSFSFDQFFADGEERASRQSPSRGVAVPVESAPPAERGADDIEQFNSWLQGLKQR